MSKKKAIEAALRCDCNEPGCSGVVWSDVAADRAYEAGRIKGLYEAAGMIDPGDAFDKESEQDVALANGSLAIRIKADALAKKARAMK